MFRSRRNKIRWGTFLLVVGTGLLYLSQTATSADSASAASESTVSFMILAIAGFFALITGIMALAFAVASNPSKSR